MTKYCKLKLDSRTKNRLTPVPSYSDRPASKYVLVRINLPKLYTGKKAQIRSLYSVWRESAGLEIGICFYTSKHGAPRVGPH